MTEKTSVSIITMGCPKNIVDSEKLAGMLLHNGFNVKFETDNANIVIVNTCGFINDAKSESIEEILAFSKLKSEGRIQKLIVSGCLSQRYKDELRRELPEVDAFFGVMDYKELVHSLKNNAEIKGDRNLITPSHYAYLKIAEGCDRSCSFCAIPYIRGRLISVPVEDLVKETKMLAAKGVKELILVAQDTISYGIDLYGRSKTAELIKELSKVDGIEWIRLMYTYPAGFPDELIDEIASNPKVVKYIDIPLQHINDEILKSMRRGHNRTKTVELINKIRTRIPSVCIRTAFIVGYPGENRAKFNELYAFAKKMKFERMGVFAYSREENTPAWDLGDPIAQRTKLKRMSDLIALHEKNSISYNESLVGKEYKVICDGMENGQFIGRLMCDAPEIDNIVFLKGENLQQGKIYTTKITGAGIYDVEAEVL